MDAQHDLLIRSLTKIFGEFDTTLLDLLAPLLEWKEIRGGETLFRQGDRGASLFFVISGRLQALVTDPDGTSRKIGEIMRGETVGEMSVFTGEPRSATVVAIRDCVVVRLSKAVFERVLDAYPLVSMNVTRLIINRLQQSQMPRKPLKKPVNVCLVALHDSVGLSAIAEELRRLLARRGTVYLASSQAVDRDRLQPGIAQTPKSDREAYGWLSHWLDELESEHEFMLFIGDSRPNPDGTLSEWTQRCLRQSDEILLFADARQSPDLSVLEQQCQTEGLLTGAAQTLVLLHPSDTVVPRHTARWLQSRPGLKSHLHLRRDCARDLARLSRILSGTAIGFVLAGGGARGFAHLGVYRALTEYGIPVDFVGGTSIGALIASTISFDEQPDLARQHARDGALYHPTKDYNWLPFISLVRGRRMEHMVKNLVQAFSGHTDTGIEDGWLTLFAVSSNYTQARQEVHTRGPIRKYLQASSAIPGVFPPVIDGNDLLVDGATFNNFPADVMSALGLGKVIGVDLAIEKPYRLTVDAVPSPRALLGDRFRPKSAKKYRFPSLVSIMLNATLLNSASRRTETKRHIDLYFNPDLRRFGLMNWAAFDAIVAGGYEHACQVLGQLSEEELAALRG